MLLAAVLHGGILLYLFVAKPPEKIGPTVVEVEFRKPKEPPPPPPPETKPEPPKPPEPPPPEPPKKITKRQPKPAEAPKPSTPPPPNPPAEPPKRVRRAGRASRWQLATPRWQIRRSVPR